MASGVPPYHTRTGPVGVTSGVPLYPGTHTGTVGAASGVPPYLGTHTGMVGVASGVPPYGTHTTGPIQVGAAPLGHTLHQHAPLTATALGPPAAGTTATPGTDTTTNTTYHNIDVGVIPESVAVNSRYLAVSALGEARVFDLSTGEQLYSFSVCSAALALRGTKLVVQLASPDRVAHGACVVDIEAQVGNNPVNTNTGNSLNNMGGTGMGMLGNSNNMTGGMADMGEMGQASMGMGGMGTNNPTTIKWVSSRNCFHSPQLLGGGGEATCGGFPPGPFWARELEPTIPNNTRATRTTAGETAGCSADAGLEREQDFENNHFQCGLRLCVRGHVVVASDGDAPETTASCVRSQATLLAASRAGLSGSTDSIASVRTPSESVSSTRTSSNKYGACRLLLLSRDMCMKALLVKSARTFFFSLEPGVWAPCR